MNKICKPFKVYVDDLKHIKAGLIGHPILLDDPKYGSAASSKECERFDISFQLAENTVKWEMIFSKKQPNLPPDVIFGTEDDEFFPNIEELEGFYNWDATSKSCLSKLMISLIKEYAVFQTKLISSLPRLREQWKDLCQTTNYSRNCETFFIRNGPGTYNAAATFLFEFPLDTSALPPYLVRENLGNDKAVLQIIFQAPDLTKITPRLFMSPRLEHALGGTASLRIPYYGASDLKSYVEKVDILLGNAVKDVVERYTRRKEFIACILSEFHGAVMEYDAEVFNEISLLLDCNNFFFVLFVSLGDKFPISCPVLVVQSIYHSTTKGPCRQTYKEYRYSPRWDSKAMVAVIRNFLTDVIPRFRVDSLQAAK